MRLPFVVRQPVLSIVPRIAAETTATTSTTTSTTASNAPEQFFPLHRIYCVGRNYRDHVVEMGGDPQRDPPVFFQKPPDACVDTSLKQNDDNICDWQDGTCVIPYPPMTSSLHYEVELVVAIGKAGVNVPTEKAMEYVFGYAVGCDLTRRDLQAQAKTSGGPWDAAKGFDFSAPCGSIVPKDQVNSVFSIPSVSNVPLSLQVNGKIKQQDTLGQMTYNIAEIVSILSRYYRIFPGDLIFTGTPAGVGAVVAGDVVEGTCGDLPPCRFRVGPKKTS